jgi:hypothetical protein
MLVSFLLNLTPRWTSAIISTISEDLDDSPTMALGG